MPQEEFRKSRRQADDDDDEALQPHADENDAGDEEERDGTGAQLADPEHLRNKDIASQKRRSTRMA